ncbi:MAG: UDP-N-acetylglucosamine 1-carboxyvinyltransferase [Candidatus Colwellbacteria bacterium]|nr:UDP-N-acetylglucosamine 1-carboxyvinyltransferase [Candidatus Colwellbacteria bacterium]
MKFIVNGGHPLTGEIRVRGFKNAATPIIAASLLTDRPCIIKNLPLIGDVEIMLRLLQKMGSELDWVEERAVRIVNKNIDPLKIDPELICQMRSSVLLVGPLLARFGEVKINTPGGCHIGARPLDTHFDAFREIGATVAYDEPNDIYYLNSRNELKVEEVALKEFSVTATENLLLYAAYQPGLRIQIAAAEPHIVDLGRFLIKLGAEITGLGSHDIEVKEGIKEGGEIEYTLINDPIEAGTFMALAAATKSKITIKDAPIESLTLPLLKFKEFGAEFQIRDRDIVVDGENSELKAVRKLMTQPYPGFPSDLQAPFAVLATQAKGETLIFDTIYEGRLKYLYELDKMGARVEILDPHRAIVKGPTKLRGKNIESLDLRAGATLIIAALVAEGESILHAAEEIDRGYEKIEERLKNLGADIKRAE